MDRSHIEESDVARLLESFDSPQVHYRVFPKTPLSRLPLRNAEAEEPVQPLVEAQLVAPPEPAVAKLVPPPVPVAAPVAPPFHAAPVNPLPASAVPAPHFNRFPAQRDVMGVAPAPPAESPFAAPPPRQEALRPAAMQPPAPAPIVTPSIMDIPGRTQDPAILSQRAPMGPQMPVLGMYHRAPAAPAEPQPVPPPAYQPPPAESQPAVQAEPQYGAPSSAPEPQYRPRPVTSGADLRDVFRKLK